MTTTRLGRVHGDRSLASLFALLAALGGCGGGGGGGMPGTGGTGGTGAGGSGGGGTCTTSSATGTLSIAITGTPSGTGLVTLAPGGDQITITTDLAVAAGPQQVQAFLVAEGGTIVRTAYEPTVDVSSPCVRAGQVTTVNVSYTPIATSGLVWTGASNAVANATLLGYDPASVAASATAAATVAADTGGSEGFTFDVNGNVWVTGATTADPPVARYPASAFATGGAKTPDVVIDSPSFGGGIPGPKVVALDQDGNLWVSVVAADKVVEFTPAQFATTNPSAAVEEAGITAPAGIAFDASGNMWVAANGASAVLRIDAAHLGTSGSGADLTITAQTPSPVIGTLPNPFGLAFDAGGNLWVNYDGTFARLTPADLAGAGTKTITPAIQIVTDVQALPLGIAFDEEAGLWFAYSAGKFARLTPAQLAVSGTPTPQIVITGSDLGYAGWFAVYPAPAFTPLAHAFP
jgi:streptogramin lyase